MGLAVSLSATILTRPLQQGQLDLPGLDARTRLCHFSRVHSGSDSVMRYSSEQAAIILDQTQNVFKETVPSDLKLDRLWWLLLYAHSACLMRALKSKLHDRVFAGPFKGMRLTPNVLAGNFVPHLIGSYEHELHPAIERAIAKGYDHVINIGCAFGYYSIGLALRLPQATIHAFDINEKETAKCREMAELNGVAARVKTGGEFRGEDFAIYPGGKTLAIVDIEAAEVGLLDPARFPALKEIDVIVELHDCYNPTISEIIRKRFEPTHEVEIIRNQVTLFPFEDAFGPGTQFNMLDSFVASWEMRDGPTPWAVMRVKNR